MNTRQAFQQIAAVLAFALAFTTIVAQAALSAEALPKADDPLSSWNEGKTKQSIVDFVARVTKPGSPVFVPVAERIAVFDNDGTLWVEQPMYFQLLFALDRVKADGENVGPLYRHKIIVARFYFNKLLPETATLVRLARSGSASLMELPAEAF